MAAIRSYLSIRSLIPDDVPVRSHPGSDMTLRLVRMVPTLPAVNALAGLPVMTHRRIEHGNTYTNRSDEHYRQGYPPRNAHGHLPPLPTHPITSVTAPQLAV